MLLLIDGAKVTYLGIGRKSIRGSLIVIRE